MERRLSAGSVRPRLAILRSRGTCCLVQTGLPVSSVCCTPYVLGAGACSTCTLLQPTAPDGRKVARQGRGIRTSFPHSPQSAWLLARPSPVGNWSRDRGSAVQRSPAEAWTAPSKHAEGCVCSGSAQGSLSAFHRRRTGGVGGANPAAEAGCVCGMCLLACGSVIASSSSLASRAGSVKPAAAAAAAAA